MSSLSLSACCQQNNNSIWQNRKMAGVGRGRQEIVEGLVVVVGRTLGTGEKKGNTGNSRKGQVGKDSSRYGAV